MTSTTTTATETGTLPDSPAAVLRAVRATRERARVTDVEQMRLGVHWADLHLADPAFAEACFTSPKTFAGEGSPMIDEFCVPEFATMLGATCDSAGYYLSECVELAYRLPQLWQGVLAGRVTPWRARNIARATIDLTMVAATFVDAQACWCANRLTPSQLSRLVDHAKARFMPDQLAKEIEDAFDRRHVTFETDQVSYDGTMHLDADLELADALALAEAVSSGAAHLATLGSADTLDGRRASALGALARREHPLPFDENGEHAGQSDSPAPPASTQLVIYAHLSTDAITHYDTGASTRECLTGYVEQAGGRVLSADQIRAWCGRPEVQVVVRPVIDVRERLETAGYTPSAKLREQVIARDRTCVFPWCGRNARRCDLDHVVPFDHDHPDHGGSTSSDNLAALCRRHHRLKTHGRWRYEMTSPGEFVWTSPLGHIYLRDHTGSRPLDASGATERAGHPPDQ